MTIRISRLPNQDTSPTMAVSKSVIVLLALVAVAAAAENARVKKQVFLPAYPYYPAPVVKTILPPAKPLGEDDGAWTPGKYDPVEVPVVAPVAALPWTAPVAYPYPYSYADDGSYFPGKYGPENIQVL